MRTNSIKMLVAFSINNLNKNRNIFAKNVIPLCRNYNRPVRNRVTTGGS